jgi:hypothetical protein
VQIDLGLDWNAEGRHEISDGRLQNSDWLAIHNLENANRINRQSEIIFNLKSEI